MAIERVLETEVMDSEQDAREYSDMNHSSVNQCFVQDLLAFAQTTWEFESDFELGDILDIGTGTALIPVELCKQHERCRVMAIDMAVIMLELAVYNLEAAGMTQRINLAQVDAKKMSFEDDMFDAVISNSTIHHLVDPKVSIKEMIRVCSDDGVIFARDLMRPDNGDSLEMIVATYAESESEHSQRLFRESLCASLTLEEMQAIVTELGFESRSVAATSDRHWTWSVRV